jgi:DNA-binding IclR family transcriptional regulator
VRRAVAPGGTQSIQRAVALLREVAARAPGGGWRLAELARRCGLDRTTAYRMLNCLIAEGLIVRSDPGQRYRLGPLAFEIGLAAQAEFDLRPSCSEALTRIAAQTGDTAFLNVRSGHDSACLDRREGGYPVKALTVEIGARRPLAASAGGLAMLMLLPEAEHRAILRENARRLAANTRLSLRTLNAMLEESNAAGCGLNLRRVIPGVIAIGVAVRNPRGAPVAALSVAAIGERLAPARRREVAALLRAEAAGVEAALLAEAGRAGDYSG